MRSRKTNECGAIAMMSGVALFVLTGFALGVLMIGKHVTARLELQNGADAAALYAAYGLQEIGESRIASDSDRFFAKQAAEKYYRVVTSGRETAFVYDRETVSDRPRSRSRIETNFSGTHTVQHWWPLARETKDIVSAVEINEVEFQATWPVVILVVDASESMGKTYQLAVMSRSAYDVIVDAIKRFTQADLPVRAGLVKYNVAVIGIAIEPRDHDNNGAAINTLISISDTRGQTNTYAGLNKAAGMLDRFRGEPVDLNLLLMTDGVPTLGGPCPPLDECHFDKAEKEGTRIRTALNTNIFTMEIRSKHSAVLLGRRKSAEEFLKAFTGQPDKLDPTMYHLAQSELAIRRVLARLRRGVCRFGPIDPLPLIRRDDDEPKRLFAFLRDTPSHREEPLRRFENIDWVPDERGFEYEEIDTDRDGKLDTGYVIVSESVCRDLKDDNHRIVVRWDDPIPVLPKLLASL